MRMPSRDAMWLQMRLLATWHLVSMLLCLQGVASKSDDCTPAPEACKKTSSTTPLWSSAEHGTCRGMALLATKWRRSLVADDQPVESQASLPDVVSSTAAPLGTEQDVNLFSNSSDDAVVAEVLVNESANLSQSMIGPFTIIGDNVTTVARSLVNGSDPPLGKDQFEPFGYPGAGLLLELHMPEVTLRELHSASHGSLATFLLELRGELSKAADVEEPRISILGIHGRFKRLDQEGLLRISTEHAGSQDVPGQPVPSSHIDEEVIVRFEVLPGWSDDAEPREVLDILRERLNNPKSELQTGPLSSRLDNATLTLSAPVGIGGSMPRNVEHRGMAHMSAMAWPIGISAAFIGVLIWLAAY